MTKAEIMQCAATLAAGVISANPGEYKKAEDAVELMNTIYGIIKEDNEKYSE